MNDYRDALAAAVEAAQEAGAILREELNQPARDGECAARAEAVLRRRLESAKRWTYQGGERKGEQNAPPHPQPLSPEAGARGVHAPHPFTPPPLHPFTPEPEAGDDDSHRWIVEPHEGASLATSGMRGCAVAVAAFRDSTPVLSVVFAYSYPDHDGDLIAWAEGCGPVARNGQPVDDLLAEIPVFAEAVTFDDRLIVYLPPSVEESPHTAGLWANPARFLAVPSVAYRLALTAIGQGVATVLLPGEEMSEAGRVLLEQAGGVVEGDRVRIAGAPLTVRSLLTRPWPEVDAPPPGDPGPAQVRPTRYPPARLSGRVIEDSAVLGRAQGCLLGQAAGDALGGLVEFEDRESILKRYPRGCRDLADGGTWDNLAGQPTDDTELALLLARSIVHAGRYDRDEVLKAYVDWWTDPRTFDRGSTIGRALSAAARGTNFSERQALIERNANRTSQANGSLMRISPIGIYSAGNPDLAANLALHESALTHPHPVCGQSCAVYLAAIAQVIATGCGPRGAYEEALRQAERLRVDSAVYDALSRAESAAPADYYTNQGRVLLALQNAFYQLLHAGGVEEGIVATVMSGGDTDTTGAIAGALLGAVHGRRAIPARWVRAVLCCRTHPGTPTDHKRAREYWPCDVGELAELLMLAGR